MDFEQLELKIFEEIDNLEDQYKWGGSEDSEGNLLPGLPDWAGAKQQITKLFNEFLSTKGYPIL